MWKVAKKFVAFVSAILMAFAGAPRANAFSLLGPFDTWQTVDLGYNLNFLLVPDVGGPMTLGEEFRWNTPTIVYGYDASFLNFFGQKGVDAIEAAIKILNDLPPASRMSGDLSEFPSDTRKFNFQAVALGVRDLKSWALSMLLESMGLATPERYVFTLRYQAQPTAGMPDYTILRRNFDPITFNPSSYVNGTLYTYSVEHTYSPPAFPDVWEAVEISVDPLAPAVTSVVALSGLQGGTTDSRGSGTLLSPGLFYSGLTRDDAGAIRYLLRPGNLNVENFPTNSVSARGGGASTSGGSPWLVAPGSTGTQTGTGTGQAAATQPAAGLPGAAGSTTNLVDLALRPGVDKIKFVRHDFDSEIGGTFTNVVVFNDTFVTNGTLRLQLVQRSMTRPDILFSAGDLGVLRGTPILIRRTIPFQTEAPNNGIGATARAGPGLIQPGVEISFSNIGPFLFNFGNQLSEELAARGEVWGSFDSSTNAPIIFPSGISIQQLESQIRKRTSGNAWRIP